ncbi:hypothetical protein [Acinetobacter pollinis]|uniref:hypothetical protein n=1 Tax=Acinetobacter pollinis TaxID=2605270 RepID=UPI0018A2D516|nr:hypothetical protein [Acinetobacter pollinis]MBF7691172.1 hypothetical protein [Acinetobacter pollinis]MBF7698888.1 hypothetical protein [Acinetobacter pollinis]
MVENIDIQELTLESLVKFLEQRGLVQTFKSQLLSGELYKGGALIKGNIISTVEAFERKKHIR